VFPELKAMSFQIEMAHQVLRTISEKQTTPRQINIKPIVRIKTKSQKTPRQKEKEYTKYQESTWY
jgi:hypothetical protein